MYEAFLIPKLCEEPNGSKITPPEPKGIILNSDRQGNMTSFAGTKEDYMSYKVFWGELDST